MKIGLMLPLADDETNGYGDLRAMALAAEEYGLDSVWGADHLIFREGGDTTGIHESWTLLTAIAAMTTRVEIGPLVLALPFRNPALRPRWPPSSTRSAAAGYPGAGLRMARAGVHGLRLSLRPSREPLRGGHGDHRAAAAWRARVLRGPIPACRRRRASPATDPPGGPPILIAGKQPRMLRMVARHAAQWNAAWYGHPDEADVLRQRLANLRVALDAEGRDPATLDITVGIFVAFDGASLDAPERAIRGTTEEIAAALAGYDESGAKHLIAHVFPRTPEAVSRLAEAAALARDRVPAVAARA